jgi:hypothetical protein
MNAPASESLTKPSSNVWLLLLLAALVSYCWQSIFLTPLKILVVFFHESSHALATLLTGGTVIAMHIVPGQGGEVLSLGGWPVLIVSAGYLGSLLIGALILLAASKSRHDRQLMAVLGMVMALLTVFFVRNIYGFAFGAAGSLAALVIAYFAPAAVSDLLLKLIGLVSMLYVPLDIYSDTLQRAHLHSDARILAEMIGGSTQLWGVLWLCVSLPVILYTLWWTRHGPAPLPEAIGQNARI